MALVKTFLETHDDGVTFYSLHSDNGHLIRCEETGELYGEVCCIDNDPLTYVEAEETIPEEDDEISDEEALRIITEGLK